MKKQIVSLLLAAAVSASALGLVACGDDNNDGSDGVLKSDKVATAAEWAAAFDFSEVTNATLYLKESGTYWDNEWDAYLKLDGEKMESTETEDGSKEYYMYKSDELGEGWDGEMYGTMYSYDYDKDTKKWTYEKYATERSASDRFKHYIQDLNEDYMPTDISEMYTDFKYDETNYEYIATWDKLTEDYSTMDDVVIKIKIKDGKIAEGSISFYLTREYDDGEKKEGTINSEFKIYDIGTTKVDIPEAEEAKDTDN